MKATGHGFAELEAALARAQREIVPQIEKVTGRACLSIKRDAQRRVRGHPHVKHYSRTINYDVWSEGLTVFGEVGADKSKGGQANLAHILEFGTVADAALPHFRPATDAEVPVWLFYIDDAAAKLLED